MARAMSLRPMGILEIVDQSFRLYRSSFLVFFGIAAVVYVPVQVVQSIPVVGTFAVVAYLPLMLIANAALTKAISDRYLGEESSIGVAYSAIGKRFWPLVGTTIIAYLFMLSGVILLGVGMIVFWFWIAFVAQVFVIEDKRYLAAVWRSRFLIGKGVWGEFLVLMIIVGVLTSIIQGAVGAIFGAPAYFLGRGEEVVTSPFVLLAFGLVQSLVLPIGQAAAVLLYYDSRIRKEGFDLEMLAREMGMAPARPAPAAPAGVTPPGPGQPV